MFINNPRIIKAAIANNLLSEHPINKEVKEAVAKGNITTTELLKCFHDQCEL